MSKDYIPDVGHLVWMSLDPTLGKEQKGKSPVLVITPKEYNQFGLCVTVPITSKMKGYNTEVKLLSDSTIEGVILTNHPRSHDWVARDVTYIETLDEITLNEVKAKLKTLLSL